MSDAFEQWAADKSFMLRVSAGDGYVNVKEMALEAWQAALQSGEPVVPEGYVLVPKTALDGALYLAGLAVAHTDFGSQHRADFKVCCDALLSAGKENNNE
jgi:hypothetical protein